MVRSDLLVSRAAQAPERHVVPTFTPRLNGWRNIQPPPESFLRLPCHIGVGRAMPTILKVFH